MNLNCGLIGLPMVGKTTIFNLLTGADAETSNYLTGKTEQILGWLWWPSGLTSQCYTSRARLFMLRSYLAMCLLVRPVCGEGVCNQF